MSLIELFVIAVGLSMDAFAVSICRGLSLERLTVKSAVTVGLYFGAFQAGMPLIGYLLGISFASKIEAYDHWIAFVLLGIIGAKMIYDSITDKDCEDGACAVDSNGKEACLRPIEMVPAALATSIDALIVGVSFAFLKADIIPAISFIGVVTFVMSIIGVCIGKTFGGKFKSKAELIGGIILIGMGFRILIEHIVL